MPCRVVWRDFGCQFCAGQAFGGSVPGKRGRRRESTSIVFAKDDPETAAVGPTQEETLPIHVEEEELQKAIEDALTRYSFTPDNLNSFYSSLRDVAVQADKGIVKISSGKQQTDLFGNPVESTGDYAGAVIAKTPGRVSDIYLCGCSEAGRFNFSDIFRRYKGYGTDEAD